MRRRPLVALRALAALTALSAATAAHAEEVELAPPAPTLTTATAAPPAGPPAPAPAPALPAPAPALPAPAPAPALPAPALLAPSLSAAAPSAAPPALSLGSCAETPQGCAAESRTGAGAGAWYGYQTLITDGVSLTLGFAAAKLGGWAGAASFGTYLLGAPIVHAVNGRPAMLAASLGTRVVSPVLGAISGLAIGAAVDGCRGGGDYACGGPIAGAAIGVVSGLVAAVALDAAVYSRVHPEAPTSSAEGRHARRAPAAWDGKPTLAPTVAASATGGTVGLGGVF